MSSLAQTFFLHIVVTRNFKWTIDQRYDHCSSIFDRFRWMKPIEFLWLYKVSIDHTSSSRWQFTSFDSIVFHFNINMKMLNLASFFFSPSLSSIVHSRAWWSDDFAIFTCCSFAFGQSKVSSWIEKNDWIPLSSSPWHFKLILTSSKKGSLSFFSPRARPFDKRVWRSIIICHGLSFLRCASFSLRRSLYFNTFYIFCHQSVTFDVFHQWNVLFCFGGFNPKPTSLLLLTSAHETKCMCTHSSSLSLPLFYTRTHSTSGYRAEIIKYHDYAGMWEKFKLLVWLSLKEGLQQQTSIKRIDWAFSSTAVDATNAWKLLSLRLLFFFIRTKQRNSALINTRRFLTNNNNGHLFMRQSSLCLLA